MKFYILNLLSKNFQFNYCIDEIQISKLTFEVNGSYKFITLIILAIIAVFRENFYVGSAYHIILDILFNS